MKWRVALVRWELKLQLRSARARVGIGVYLAVCTLALVLVFLAGRDGSPYAPSLYLWQLLKVQPFLSVVLATMIAGARASGPARQHIWPVLAGASISDSGYLFGRWLAFQVLLLPVAAVPLVLAGTMSILAGSPWPEPSFWLGASWLGLWAAHVVVVMMMVSAGWLAAVTLTGSEGFALSLCLVILPLLTTILNRLLFNLHLKVMSVSVLKTFLLFGQWLEEVTHQIPGNLFASEAPVDSRAILEWLVPQVTYSLAVTVFAAGLATLYVRRTRRDLRPWSVPEDHVLRTVLLGMARLRERLVPGAALSRGDLLAATLGVVALVAGIGFSLQRQAHFQHLAEDRYAAETRAAVEPLAADIVPVTWRVQAALRRDGALTVQFRETFLNRGEGPHDHFAFSLDEQMELADLVAGSGRDVRVERHWDRLALTIEPPLLPGETLELSGRLTGIPGDIHFMLGRFSFATAFSRHQTTTSFVALRDLSASYLQRAATPARVRLIASQLAPVPRYTSWQHVRRDDDVGVEVPEEQLLPKVDLDIDLTAPPEWFLVDPCGHTSGDDSGSRLKGSCRVRMGEYKVRGGELEVSTRDDMMLAALPSHHRLSQPFLEKMAIAMAPARRAWPELADFQAGMVAVVAAFDDPVAALYRRPPKWQDDMQIDGRVLVVPDHTFTFGRGLNLNHFVAYGLAERLMEERPVVEREVQLFRDFYIQVTFHRMGARGGGDARVSGPPWLASALRKPLFDDQGWLVRANMSQLMALAVDLESRLGVEAFHRGFNIFLEGPGEGTFLELMASLEAAGTVPLERFVDDFLFRGALPELRLEDVAARPRGEGWEVHGAVRNVGTGEVVCPLFVKTEVATHKLMVTVGSETARSFAVVTQDRPILAELDPEGTCYRLVGVGSAKSERVALL